MKVLEWSEQFREIKEADFKVDFYSPTDVFHLPFTFAEIVEEAKRNVRTVNRRKPETVSALKSAVDQIYRDRG